MALYKGTQKICPIVNIGGSATVTYPKGNYYVLDDDSIFPMLFSECIMNGASYAECCITSYASTMDATEKGVWYRFPKVTPADYTNTVLGSIQNVSMNAYYLDVSKVVHISLTGITGKVNFRSAFSSSVGFTSLKSVDCSRATDAYLSQAFQGTPLESIDLSSLSSLTDSTALGGPASFGGTFANCTSLQTLSFPALNSTSFGTRTNQFNYMLKGVTGCTVHFPSNLQSVIGSWSSVTSGFGGVNTTVLFDLPATT